MSAGLLAWANTELNPAISPGNIQRSNCSSPSEVITLTRTRPLTTSHAAEVGWPRLSKTWPSVQVRSTPTLCSAWVDRAVRPEFCAKAWLNSSASNVWITSERPPLFRVLVGRREGGSGMIFQFKNVFFECFPLDCHIRNNLLHLEEIKSCFRS